MELVITNTDEDMASWLDKPYLNEATRQLLTGIDIMIVPEENFREYEVPLFPSNLMLLYDKLKIQFNIEAAINDEDYHEVSLNSRTHRYGKYIANYVIVPLFVTVLGTIISDQLRNDPEDEVEIEIIVQHGRGESTSVKYQGPAKGFDKAATKIKEIANHRDNHEHRTDTAKSANAQLGK